MSIWGSIKNGLKKAGQVAGDVLGGAVGTVKDGAENKDHGQSDDASKDKGHDS